MIDVTFTENAETFEAVLSEGNEFTLSLAYDAIHDETETYTGAYDITPDCFDAQTLPTAYKKLTKNVTVQKVPHFETSNEYGETFYIGEL